MRRFALVALLITFPAGVLAAQGRWLLAPGERVRVETDSGPLIGTVMGQDSANLQIRSDGEHESVLIAVPQRRIAHVAVSAGRGSNAGKGAAIGAGVGAGLGLALGIACANAQDRLFPHCDGSQVAEATLVVGISGALWGGLIGALSTHERWQPLAPAAAHLSLGVGRRGLRAGITVPI